MSHLALFSARGMIQVQLPEQIQQVVDRQAAEGRMASQGDFLIEAARRLVEVEAGITDAEAGRFVTIATAEDAAALHE